jgi:hypothetical protein
MNPKPEAPPIRILEIRKIHMDGGTQGRVSVDNTVIREYAELMKSGVEFPPVRAWFDGAHYWLVDGFQRVAAMKQIGRQRAAAEVLEGTLEEAKWDSYGANWSHGVRRTAADIQSIIRKALEHPKAMQLSNNEIARHLHLPEATFRRWKRRFSSASDEDTVRLVKRSGAIYQMDTASIGKGRDDERSSQLKSCRRLQQDLEEMKSSASPEARRVLNILGNWVRNNSSALSILAAIEALLSELGHPRVTVGRVASMANKK